MCDLPQDEDPFEAIEKARQEGWMPVVVVLCKTKEIGGRPAVDVGHLHFVFAVELELALMVAMVTADEAHTAMVERDRRRAREN